VTQFLHYRPSKPPGVESAELEYVSPDLHVVHQLNPEVGLQVGQQIQEAVNAINQILEVLDGSGAILNMGWVPRG